MQRLYLGRRQAIQLLGFSTLSYGLQGCVPRELTRSVGNFTEPLNQTFEELILRPQTPVPEFPTQDIEPKALLINTYDQTPVVDPSTFRLVVDGDVEFPMQFSLADLQKLPLTTMVMRHVCVEGWAAIVQWGGVQLQALAKLVQPRSQVRYVYFESADRYYESWDLASALHPQTLLAYQHNGEPLSVEHGAPLRLAAPIKLGYKQSKWVTRLRFTRELETRKGFWEDQGYEWFAGL